MTAGAGPRWLMSFADLLMLLLAFFVVLGASQQANRAQMGAGLRQAFGGNPAAASGKILPAAITLAPDRLFEPGEAVLRPGLAHRLAAIGARFATARRLALTSSGEGGGSARLDRFELAAARTAALARALALPPARLAVGMTPGPRAGMAQRVTLSALD